MFWLEMRPDRKLRFKRPAAFGSRRDQARIRSACGKQTCLKTSRVEHVLPVDHSRVGSIGAVLQASS